MVGECNYAYNEARKITYREYLHKIAAYEKRKNNQWEIVRYQVFHDLLGNPYIKKGDKPKRPTDLFKLSTDVRDIPTTDVSVSEEELEALRKIDFFK